MSNNTKMNDTSLEAYKEIIEDGTITMQEAKVLNSLDYAQTSRQIASNTGLERSSVCGRINKLVEKNLVKEFDKIKCPTSGKTVHRYLKVIV